MVFKRVLKAVSVAMTVCILLSLCGFTELCEGVYGRVMRLHVIAASDSEKDQHIKLQVRDAVICETQGLLDGVRDVAQAKEKLEAVLPSIEKTAQRVLKENGVQDRVRTELCTMYFPTRQYEHVTLPAGKYQALRLVIGEGKGKNWWCVVFPPMCLSGACELSDVLTEQQEDIVTHPTQYEVRFKVVEWYQKMREWLE